MTRRVGAADGVNLKLGRRFLTTCLLRIPELELPRGDSGTAGGARVQGCKGWPPLLPGQTKRSQRPYRTPWNLPSDWLVWPISHATQQPTTSFEGASASGLLVQGRNRVWEPFTWGFDLYALQLALVLACGHPNGSKPGSGRPAQTVQGSNGIHQSAANLRLLACPETGPPRPSIR
jgi:hypothetical protein